MSRIVIVVLSSKCHILIHRVLVGQSLRPGGGTDTLSQWNIMPDKCACHKTSVALTKGQNHGWGN
jgi:hypothetical protein